MDIGKYIRIFETGPDDAFIEKRESAIKDLRAHFLKNATVQGLVTLASDCFGVFEEKIEMPDELAQQVELAIQKYSPSFEAAEKDLEVGVCAALAILGVIKSSSKATQGWLVADVLAFSCWSGLAFLAQSKISRLEDLRSELVEASRARILKTGLETRERVKVPDFAEFGASGTKEEFAKSTSATIAALKYNSALDREEIDLLWWVLSGYSNLMCEALASLDVELRAIAAGIEVGSMLRALPTAAHRNLALKGINSEKKYQLSDLLTALGNDMSQLAESYSAETIVDAAPAVFPLLHSIRHNTSSLEGGRIVRTLGEWAARALLERSVLRIQHAGKREI